MFRKLFRRRKANAELDEEIRFYLDQETRLRVDRGESYEEARRAARRDFGNVLLVQEATRQVWGWTLVENLVRDLRFGARLLLRSPLGAATAIVSLALGIGANTAIFSLIDMVMLRSLPVRDPGSLVQLQKIHAEGTRGGLSYPLYEELQRNLSSFEGLLAQSSLRVRDIQIDGRTENVKVQFVSGNYFQLLGVEAHAGSVFTGENPGAVAVLGHRYWRRRFSADPAALGRTVQIGKAAVTIAGVTPPEFFGATAGEMPDLILPASTDGLIRGRTSWTLEPGISWLSALGRLRAGATVEQARAEAAAVFARILDAQKGQRTGRARDIFLAQRLELYPAAGGFDDLRRRFSEPLSILMAVVGLVLLIACANVANLLLARSAARQREIAVRLAIGAGHGRIIRQLLAEGLLLAGLGGALGVVLALGFGNWLVAMMSNGGERIAIEVRPDLRVLSFACAVSAGACLIFSLFPAIQAVRGSLQFAFGDLRAPRWRLGRGLIVAQFAITLLLLVGAGLFGRTLYNMYAQDAGFNRHNVLTFTLDSGATGYRADAVPALYLSLLADLRALPGVVSASAVWFTPISGFVWDSSISVEGYTPGPQESTEASLNAVGPDYFRTMGTTVLAGREFDDRDNRSSKPVAVVSESFARHYFRGQSPIGRWVMRRPDRYEIVGVVKDSKYRNLRQPAPRLVYLAAAQQAGGRGWDSLVVRAASDAPSMLRAIDAAVRRRDPTLRVVEPVTLDQLASRSLLHERMLATLAIVFGGLALLLSAIGIYGVLSFQVARRRKEIGVRMALGAAPREIVAMLLRQSAGMVLAGAAIGIPCAIGLARFTTKILYGIKPVDPVTIAASVACLALVAIAAAWLPGRTASRADVTESLRCD